MKTTLLQLALLLAFTISSAFGDTSLSHPNKKCGIYKPGGLTTNAAQKIDATKQAGMGEFPWTVALYKDNYIMCVGSLIAPSVVLTAGHCVKSVNNQEIVAKIGLWDVSMSSEQYPVQERKVSSIVVHPDFTKENTSIKNDIALIVLDKAVELADHIGFACLANKDHQEVSNQCFAAGWGKENKDAKSPTILKKLHLPIVTKENCAKKLKGKFESLHLTDKTLCAGGDKASTCLGDGGAALVCKMESSGENRLLQSGITSFGFGCANEFPGVYTNVAGYREWIDENIKKLGAQTKYYEA